MTDAEDLMRELPEVVASLNYWADRLSDIGQPQGATALRHAASFTQSQSEQKKIVNGPPKSLLYLLLCVEQHADKFPAPAHMRERVAQIRRWLAQPVAAQSWDAETVRARAASVICEVGALCGWPGPDCKSREAAEALFNAGLLSIKTAAPLEASRGTIPNYPEYDNYTPQPAADAGDVAGLVRKLRQRALANLAIGRPRKHEREDAALDNAAADALTRQSEQIASLTRERDRAIQERDAAGDNWRIDALRFKARASSLIRAAESRLAELERELRRLAR